MERCDETFHEARLLIRERNRGARRAARKARNEEGFLNTNGRTKCQNKMDKMNRVDVADSLRLLKKISDEAELLLEQTRLQDLRTARGILGAHADKR